MFKDKCRMCYSKNLKVYLDLGLSPHSDRFPTKEQLNQKEEYYPLRVQICLDCGLHQLDYVVPAKILYQDDYLYESSITETGKKHYFSMADYICTKYGIKPNSFVVDIGSNVGVLLEGFKNNSMNVFGVDAAPRIVEIANKRGIPTRCDLFGKSTAEEVIKEKGKASVITATNLFAHIDDLYDFMEGIKTLLDEKGIFIFELPYLVDLIENLEYDTIYHQHLSYISIKPLIPFFKKYGMEIFDVIKSDIHGGSIRVFVDKSGERSIMPIVENLLQLEENKKVYDLQKLEEFSKRVENHRFELVSLLYELKKQGKTIVGIGAPAKGNTLLNYCHIHNGLLDYLTEKSELKKNRYSPGLLIPIYSDEKIIQEIPDYALILPWNFSKEIMKNLQEYKEKGGKFIIPIPNPKIV